MWVKAMTNARTIYFLLSITIDNTNKSFFNPLWIMYTWKGNIHGISCQNDTSIFHHNYTLFKYLFTWIMSFMIMAFYTHAIWLHKILFQATNKYKLCLSYPKMSRTSRSQHVLRCFNGITPLLNIMGFWFLYTGRLYWPVVGSKLHDLLIF